MTEKEVLANIGVSKVGVFNNDAYTVELNDDVEWGKVFSLLEKNEDLEELEDSVLNVDGSALYYEYNGENNEAFLLTLTSSFEDDVYTLTVEKEE